MGSSRSHLFIGQRSGNSSYDRHLTDDNHIDLCLCSDTETIDIICGATVLGWRDYWKRVSETNAWADIPLSYVLRAFTADEQEAREQEQLAAEEEEAEAERAMENLQEMMDGPFFHESWSDTDSDPMGLGLGLASTGGPHL